MPSSISRKRSNIKDVARLAGLSIASVSRYINATVVVSERSAAKIQAAIEELHFIPQTAAQVLARKKTNTIGLLLTGISGDFFAPMLRGIETRAMEDGYSLLIHSTEIQSELRSPFNKILAEHNTDGLIVFTTSLNDAELTRLNAIGFPVVLLHRSTPQNYEIPYVIVENKNGARSMIDHLIDVHHWQRIVHLQGPADHEDAYWRGVGYRQSLEAHGILYDPQLIGSGEFSAAQARIAVQSLLSRDVKFDAIFAGDDESASGALMELRMAGIRVPEEVAVVGFDDLNLAAHLTPQLTTVHAPIEEAGYEAVDKLVRLMRGEQVELETMLPTQLIIRKSCGCS